MSSLSKILISVLVIMALIIFAGILINNRLSTTAQTMENYLNIVEQHTSNKNWSQSQNEFTRVMQYWDELEKSWTIMANHTDIDEISTSLNRIKKLIDLKESSMVLSELYVLKELVRNVPQKEKLTLNNIL